MRNLLGIVGLGILGIVATACGSDSNTPSGTTQTTEEIRADSAKAICDSQRAAKCDGAATPQDCEESILTEWKDGEDAGCGDTFQRLVDCLQTVSYDCAEDLGLYRAECNSKLQEYEDCSGQGQGS